MITVIYTLAFIVYVHEKYTYVYIYICIYQNNSGYFEMFEIYFPQDVWYLLLDIQLCMQS